MRSYTEIREKAEQWAPVKGYEGLYAISNFGNIVSLMFRNNICTKPKIQTVSPYDNGNGYLMVQLSDIYGNRKPCYVHRLVGEVFLDNPNGLPVINHIDHNRSNNRADNLEWTTQKENVNHSAERMKKPKGKSRPTNTGEKYISFRKNRYRVFGGKSFKTLEEAVKYRNEVIGGGE